MNKKVVSFIVALLFALSVGACSTVGTFSSGTYNAPDGSVFDNQSTKDLDLFGLDSKSMTIYHTVSVYNPLTKKFEPKTSMIDNKAGFVDGLGKQLSVAVVKGILESGGWIAGAYLFNSAGEVVGAISNNVSASATGGSVKNNNKNININKNDNRNSNFNINNNGNKDRGCK